MLAASSAWLLCPALPCSQEEYRRNDYAVIVPEQCVWSLEEDTSAEGERCKLLVVTMARPDPTEEEVTYKKGEC